MSFGSTVNCPHCSAGNQSGSKFCESCGKALPEAAPSGPTVVNPYTAASTTAGQSVQAGELRKRAGSAVGALLAVAILQSISGVIFFVKEKRAIQAGITEAQIVLAIVVGLILVFFGLAFWARSNPLPAAIIGLILYLTLNLLLAIQYILAEKPGLIAQGIIVKVIIIVVLIKAIQAGAQHRNLQRQMAGHQY